MNIRITSFEQKITIISQENDELRIRVNQLTQYESKCVEMGREIERLNDVIRNLQRDS